MTIELQAISRRFGDRWILQDLDLQVGQGECVALLGASGCGKSTALRLIAGLDQPNRGSILIHGRKVNNVPARERRIGMVFQSYALFPHLSVRENLELGLRTRGAAVQDRRQRIATILEVVQLTDRAEELPSQLSGGQRQRVALARALLSPSTAVSPPAFIVALHLRVNRLRTAVRVRSQCFERGHAGARKVSTGGSAVPNGGSELQ